MTARNSAGIWFSMLIHAGTGCGLRVAGLSIGDLGLWISDWKDLMGPIQVMGCGVMGIGHGA